MFNPKNYKSFTKTLASDYRSVIKDCVIVMNAMKFNAEMMDSFKSGVEFNTRIDNAKYSITINKVNDAINFINEGKDERWSRITIDICADGKTRCFLRERKQNKNQYTHMLIANTNKVELVSF